MSPGQFSANYMVERGDFEPKWTLHVYEVPRLYRHKVKALLYSEGFPRLREWLLKLATITGRDGGCAFIISFDEAQQMLEYEVNEQIDPKRERGL
jgi:hypothetical protein